ncbi:MAG: ribose-5-phosphate isomerase RpiA, partial [Cohaesibacteraceae bacterium]|nr:ribose-5-phosphate isomerase RpiA [Cohaesibacteraceae bacterium]
EQKEVPLDKLVFLKVISNVIKSGMDIVGVPTSEATARQCREENIPLTTLEDCPILDLTVDGADELDDQLNLIKGGGGALLREKIVAAASKKMIVIADSSKHVSVLGAFALPIEVNFFGHHATLQAVNALGKKLGLDGLVTIRKTPSGDLFVTDGGHYIYDAAFGRIPDPGKLDEELRRIPGVVETGLFIGLASEALLADPNGVRRIVCQ